MRLAALATAPNQTRKAQTLLSSVALRRRVPRHVVIAAMLLFSALNAAGAHHLPQERKAMIDAIVEQSYDLKSNPTEEAAIRRMQEWLIWAGAYTGPVEGKLDDRTISAIRAYLKSKKLNEYEILTSDQIKTLASESRSKIDVLEFYSVKDEQSGIQIPIPNRSLPIRQFGDGWAEYEATDKLSRIGLRSVSLTNSFEILYQELNKSLSSNKIDFKSFNKDWFIISGVAAGKNFILRFHFNGITVAGFYAVSASESKMPSAALTLMSNGFIPFEESSTVSSVSATALSGELARLISGQNADSELEGKPRSQNKLAELRFDGKEHINFKLGSLTLRIDAIEQKNKKDEPKEAVPRVVGTFEGRSAFTMAIPFEHGRDEPAAIVSVSRMNRSQKIPDVVLEYHWGGAHCCTVTRLALGKDKGNWPVVNAETLDGDGYNFKDLDNDGTIELVSADNRFLYRFASYAGSVAPTRIHAVRNDTLVEVTQEKRFQNVLREHVNRLESNATKEDWSSNGFLAGWVAAKALIGDVDSAWTRMLSSFDRDDEWDLSTCTLKNVSISDCPKNRLMKPSFPDALALHLQKHGFISAQHAQRLAHQANSTPVRATAEADPAGLLARCVNAKETVKVLILRNFTFGASPTEGMHSTINVVDDFTADTYDRAVDLVGCSVSYSLNIRSLIGKMAEQGLMDPATRLNQAAKRVGNSVSARVRFTVKPTSDPKKSWVTLLP